MTPQLRCFMALSAAVADLATYNIQDSMVFDLTERSPHDLLTHVVRCAAAVGVELRHGLVAGGALSVVLACDGVEAEAEVDCAPAGLSNVLAVRDALLEDETGGWLHNRDARTA